MRSMNLKNVSERAWKSPLVKTTTKRDEVNHFNKIVINMAVKDFFTNQKVVQKGVVFTAKQVLRFNIVI